MKHVSPEVDCVLFPAEQRQLEIHSTVCVCFPQYSKSSQTSFSYEYSQDLTVHAGPKSTYMKARCDQKPYRLSKTDGLAAGVLLILG